MESLIGNEFYSHASKTHLYRKGFVHGLVLKVQIFRTWKWPIFKVIQNRWHSDSADVLKSQKYHENCDLAAK